MTPANGQVAEADAVLRFWFADAAFEPAKARERMSFWFTPNRKTDTAISTRFADLIGLALADSLTHWGTSPRTALALVLVLDQFPRNVWRGSADAFACDERALGAAAAAVSAGYLHTLSPAEQAFLLMPYQHVESLVEQRKGCLLFEAVAQLAPAPWKPLMENFLAFSKKHLAIIERFGRFPHRNDALQRPSTPEEKAFLGENPTTFGQ